MSELSEGEWEQVQWFDEEAVIVAKDKFGIKHVIAKVVDKVGSADANAMCAAKELLAACELEERYQHYYGSEHGMMDNGTLCEIEFLDDCRRLGWNSGTLGEFVSTVCRAAIAKARGT